jgi:homoserine kinase type II
MDYQQLAQRALRDFDLGKIVSTEKMPTSGNIAFKIITSTGDYFLRLSPNDPFRGRSRREILAEAELLQHLADNGLPVQPPINNRVISIDGMNGYIRLFAEGVAVEEPSPEQVEKFGQLLGKMHKVCQGYQTTNKREHIWDLPTTKQNLAEDEQIISKAISPNFFKSLKAAFDSIKQPSDLPKGMIHEDLGKRHILWQGIKIVSVLDFDRCYFGNLVDDLGQATRGWCFAGNGDFIKQNYQALLDGYQSQRQLVLAERTALPGSVKFAFLERALSFILRGIFAKNNDLIKDGERLLQIAQNFDGDLSVG